MHHMLTNIDKRYNYYKANEYRITVRDHLQWRKNYSTEQSHKSNNANFWCEQILSTKCYIAYKEILKNILIRSNILQAKHRKCQDFSQVQEKY